MLFHTHQMKKIKIFFKSEMSSGGGQTGTLKQFDGRPLGRTTLFYLVKQKTHVLHNPEILRLDVHPRKILLPWHKDTHVSLYKRILRCPRVAVEKTGKKSKRPLAEEWTDRVGMVPQ